MSKQSFRNITIHNGNVEEKWKWRFGNKDVTIISPDNKKTYVSTTKFTKTAFDEHNDVIGSYVSPKMVALYIYKMLGIQPPKKKPQQTIQPRTLDKSKVYVIFLTHTYHLEDYNGLDKEITLFEIWQDPSKAKKRTQELNLEAQKRYIYDRMNSPFGYSRNINKNLLKQITFKEVEDVFKFDESYNNMLKSINSLQERHPSIGYKFHSEERDFML